MTRVQPMVFPPYCMGLAHRCINNVYTMRSSWYKFIRINSRRNLFHPIPDVVNHQGILHLLGFHRSNGADRDTSPGSRQTVSLQA